MILKPANVQAEHSLPFIFSMTATTTMSSFMNFADLSPIIWLEP